MVGRRLWVAGALGATMLAAPAMAQQAGSTDAQLKQLQDEVRALQARVAELEAARAASAPAAGTAVAAAPAAEAPAAPAAAGAAQVAATAPSAQGAPAPAPVTTEAAAAGGSGGALPAWLADTKIGGKAYLNLSAIHQRSDGKKGPQDGVQVDLKRFYLTVDHRFSNVFSANLTTDVRYGTNGTSNDTLVYVKKAYLQATLAPQFYVRVGAADLPWVPFVEDVYGYRFVENVLDERARSATSSDYGVHIGGTFAGGLVSYAVSAIDGLGYKTRTRNSDTVDLSGRLSVQPVPHVVLAVGGYTGKLGKSVAGEADTPHHATRLDALAAYTGVRLRAGLEYFEARNWNTVTSRTADKTSGWSVFGSYAITPKVAVFGRYDWVNPFQYTNPAAREHYVNAGIDYQAVPGVGLALVYKHDRADDALVPTSNGTIGGARTGTYDEIGIWSQLKF